RKCFRDLPDDRGVDLDDRRHSGLGPVAAVDVLLGSAPGAAWPGTDRRARPVRRTAAGVLSLVPAWRVCVRERGLGDRTTGGVCGGERGALVIARADEVRAREPRARRLAG